MATPDVTGGVRAVYNYIQHGEQRANVLHGIKATDWTLAELTNLALALKGVWDTNFRNWIADDVALETIVCTSLEGSASEQYTYNCLINCNGTNASAPAPGNASSTLSLRTSGIGRSKRGRMYPPGYVETHINDDDTIQSAHLTSLAGLGSALMTAFINTSSSNLGVFSRVLNTIAPVVSIVLENILDTQRRRLPQRGR